MFLIALSDFQEMMMSLVSFPTNFMTFPLHNNWLMGNSETDFSAVVHFQCLDLSGISEKVRDGF